MLATEIYNFIISNKLIESVFILFSTIFILVFIIKNTIIISGIILMITIILFVLNLLPLWLFSLLIIIIGGEIYNKIIKREGLNG